MMSSEPPAVPENPLGTTSVEVYLSELASALKDLAHEPLMQVLAVLRRARAEHRHVFVFGNGGSASTASHMACDLAKNTRHIGEANLRIIALTDGIATLSAYANDDGYETVFAEPLRSLGRSGDVAIAISASGNSPNVLRAIRVAKELDMETIALSGSGGGQLTELVDVAVLVPARTTEQTNDVHLILNHILTLAIRDQR